MCLNERVNIDRVANGNRRITPKLLFNSLDMLLMGRHSL